MHLIPVKPISSAAFLLPAALVEQVPALLAEVRRIAALAPFRIMQTRSGKMSVAMTNCGAVGWVSDNKGYRYSKIDPLSGKPWPAMPRFIADLASRAAAQVGFSDFAPNVCLINQYRADSRLGLHVDKDEGDDTQPIVSFSLGAPAIFRWGGLKATDVVENILLKSGDIVVWGGQDRLRYHGISKVYAPDIESGFHERYVMTFRYTRRWQLN